MLKRRLNKAFARPMRDLIINGLAGFTLVNTWLRGIIYKAYGMKLKDPVWIKPGCSFDSADIEIGDHTWINYNCSFNNSATIKIGSNCDIAFNVMFVCGTHEIGGFERRAGDGKSLPITVGDGCWIGANVTILPGVNIGPGCVIGAGSVVTKSCEADGVYAGVPARLIKKLTDRE